MTATIKITVSDCKDNREAFELIERLLDLALGHKSNDGIRNTIHVSTPDGVHATEF